MQQEAAAATRKKPDSSIFFRKEANEASRLLGCPERAEGGTSRRSDGDELIKQIRNGRLLELFGPEQAIELAAECKTVIENQVRSCFVFQQSFCSREAC